MNEDKRYEVYFWNKKSISECENIYGCKFEVRAPIYASITQFAEMLGAIDDKQEALQIIMNKKRILDISMNQIINLPYGVVSTDSSLNNVIFDLVYSK